MANAWQQLVASQVEVDRQRRSVNPGGDAFSTLVKTAMQTGLDKKAELRKETAVVRGTAAQAAFSRYPDVAAEHAGITVPESAGAPELPEGFRMKQATVGEDGQVSYQYGEELSEATLAKMYNDYTTEVDKTNSMYALLPDFSPVEKPTFEEFKSRFGIGGSDVGITSQSEDQILQALGVTEEDIEFTMQQSGMAREQVIAFLRSQLTGA